MPIIIVGKLDRIIME